MALHSQPGSRGSRGLIELSGKETRVNEHVGKKSLGEHSLSVWVCLNEFSSRDSLDCGVISHGKGWGPSSNRRKSKYQAPAGGGAWKGASRAPRGRYSAGVLCPFQPIKGSLRVRNRIDFNS